jgi:poly(3-hydroxyoctanoate) depolymerase
MLNEYFTWRRLRIHVQERGHGEPLMLINGLGANTDMWSLFSARFSDRRIILFDAPGTGRSSTPAHPISISSLADLAVAVLDNRGIEQADVLGYSYGGAIAQQMAFEDPDRVRKLVLAATNCGVGAVFGSPQAMSVLSTPFRYYSATYFDRTAASLYGGRTARDPVIRRHMMASRSQFPPSSMGYGLQILAGIGWSSRHFLHEIGHETLVISGDDDPLIPVVNAQYLADRIPNARLDVVERAGHLFLCDDARHLAERIREFVGPQHAKIVRMPSVARSRTFS